jgi:choline transport protein
MQLIISVSELESAFSALLTIFTAEEIQDAPRVIPLSMGVSNLLNGAMGFVMLLALLFCMPNSVDSVLNNETFFPFIGIYTYAVGSKAGGTALVSN